MKTIEDIEKEYNEYKCELDMITSIKELDAWLEVRFDDIDEYIKVLNKDSKDNDKSKIFGYIKNQFPFIFEYDDISFYDKDNKIVKDACTLSRMYQSYIKHIVYYSTEDNYKEMAKLSDFIMMYYYKDLDYLYGERDELEYRRKGYGCVCNDVEDNSLVVHEFFATKISEFKEAKGIEKVHKM